MRDEGPGFDPDAVAAERRGIRDAVVGRMESVGGLATIESKSQVRAPKWRCRSAMAGEPVTGASDH